MLAEEARRLLELLEFRRKLELPHRLVGPTHPLGHLVHPPGQIADVTLRNRSLGERRDLRFQSLDLGGDDVELPTGLVDVVEPLAARAKVVFDRGAERIGAAVATVDGRPVESVPLAAARSERAAGWVEVGLGTVLSPLGLAPLGVILLLVGGFLAWRGRGGSFPDGESGA